MMMMTMMIMMMLMILVVAVVVVLSFLSLLLLSAAAAAAAAAFRKIIIIITILLFCRRTLDGDACCPHQSCCPLQLLQVAIDLVPQRHRFWPHVPLKSSCSWQCCSSCSAVMSALHGSISDSTTLNLLYMWAVSLLCLVLSLDRITSTLLCRLFDWLAFGCCRFHFFL